MIVVPIVPISAFFAYTWLTESNVFFAFMFFLMAIILLLTYRLTVEADDESLRVSLGIGLIKRTLDWNDIVSCKPVRNAWWRGWGMRKIPRGWMFNVSGFHAVELELANGRTFRIGTDEPENLAEAIRERLGD